MLDHRVFALGGIHADAVLRAAGGDAAEPAAAPAHVGGLLGKDLLQGFADEGVLLAGGRLAQGGDMGGEGLAATLLGGIDRGEHGDQTVFVFHLVAALVEQAVELIDIGTALRVGDLLTHVHQQVGEPHRMAGLIADVVRQVAHQLAGLAVERFDQGGELLAGALLVEAVAVEEQHLQLALLHHLSHHLAGADAVVDLARVGDGHRGADRCWCWAEGNENGGSTAGKGWAAPDSRPLTPVSVPPSAEPGSADAGGHRAGTPGLQR